MDIRPRQRTAEAACRALARAALQARPTPAPGAPEPEVPAVTVRRRSPPRRALDRMVPTVGLPVPSPPATSPDAPIARERPETVQARVTEPLPMQPEPAPGVPAAAVPEAIPPRPLAEPVAEAEGTPDGVGEAAAGAEGASGGTRTEPTRNGRIILDALQGRPPMRKTDIAVLAGIGRGAANRSVDRLVEDGWMVPDGANLFRLAEPQDRRAGG